MLSCRYLVLCGWGWRDTIVNWKSNHMAFSVEFTVAAVEMLSRILKYLLKMAQIYHISEVRLRFLDGSLNQPPEEILSGTHSTSSLSNRSERVHALMLLVLVQFLTTVNAN